MKTKWVGLDYLDGLNNPSFLQTSVANTSIIVKHRQGFFSAKRYGGIISFSFYFSKEPNEPGWYLYFGHGYN